VAVVYIGINDVWWRKTSPQDFEQALVDLHKAAAANGTKLIFTTLAVYRERPDGSNEKDKLCDQFAELTRKVARQQSVPLVDLRTAFVNYLKNHNVELRVNGDIEFANMGILTGDGVHPNQKGNELIADLIANELAETLTQ
jgi:lysophospholipase L1-like esterase